MKDRIKKIIESQGMTQQEFAECIKVAPATLSSIFTGRTAPSLKIVEAIKSRFPDISTDWLMFGRGAMTDYHAVEAGSQSSVRMPSDDDASRADVAEASTASVSSSRDVRLSAGARDAVGGADAVRRQEESRQTSGEGRKIAGVGVVSDDLFAVKKYDKHERNIVEIRIFYDDQTWETFVPKR